MMFLLFDPNFVYFRKLVATDVLCCMIYNLQISPTDNAFTWTIVEVSNHRSKGPESRGGKKNIGPRGLFSEKKNETLH